MMLLKAYIAIYKENPKMWGFALLLFLISSFILGITITDVLVDNPFKEYRLTIGIIYFVINRPFISLFQKRLGGEEISFSIRKNISKSINNVKTVYAQDKRGWCIAFLIILLLLLVIILSHFDIFLQVEYSNKELIVDICFFILIPTLLGLSVYYGIRKKELKDKGIL